jgi:hypothetical protein
VDFSGVVDKALMNMRVYGQDENKGEIKFEDIPKWVWGNRPALFLQCKKESMI